MDNPQTSNAGLERQVVSQARINKRPRSVTLLIVIVLIITVINLIRLVLSVSYWNFLSTRSGISPIYLAATGLVWSATGIFLVWGLWKAKNWAPRLMQTVTLTYALYYWLDHIFLMDRRVSGGPGAISAILPMNWQFAAGLTAVLVIFIAWTFTRSKVKLYFGADVQDKNQDLNAQTRQDQ